MNVKTILLIIIFVILLLMFYYVYRETNNVINLNKNITNKIKSDQKFLPLRVLPANAKVLTDNLHTVWEVASIGNGEYLVTERPGNVKLVSPIPERNKTFPIPGVFYNMEAGMLGLAVHPDFANNRYFYIYYTTIINGQITNQIVRYRLTDDLNITDRYIILDQIPGASQHNGGRLAFGPDGYLYATAGDADLPRLAQDTNSLGGKILRMTDEGEIPPDNPFSNFVYSYGHRNPQGLAWDGQGGLWSTEHGPQGHDKINYIVNGGNYGWPNAYVASVPSAPYVERQGPIIAPYLSSGQNTWAPAGATVIGNTLYFGGLRGSAIFALDLTDPEKKLYQYYHNVFGRIRAVTKDESNLVIGTSNLDGWGQPKQGDDMVIYLKQVPVPN